MGNQSLVAEVNITLVCVQRITRYNISDTEVAFK